jgi:hypothetical protein
LYVLLFMSQLYLAILALLNRPAVVGHVARTLTYVTLTCAFGFLALGTVNPPLMDLVEYRWLLRGSYTAYFLLSVYALMRFWVRMWRTRRGTLDSRLRGNDGGG